MKIQVLGCSAVELPNSNLPSFLVDGKLLLDAGTIGTVLNQKEQWKIGNVLITHSHIDHIKDLPFFADNISINNRSHQVNVISISAVNKSLKQNLFNDILWPDFTKIPTAANPNINLKNIRPGRSFRLDGYKITAYKVTHTVPAVGYLLENNKGKRLLYIGDTGPNDLIWKVVTKKLNCLIIEVSLPDRFKSMALYTGHLTPMLLSKEINKMKYVPDRICITHCKPRYRETIEKELKRLNTRNIRILRDGMKIKI
jgi:ribonuclease BN (tRNA processing enzyme)